MMYHGRRCDDGPAGAATATAATTKVQAGTTSRKGSKLLAGVLAAVVLATAAGFGTALVAPVGQVMEGRK